MGARSWGDDEREAVFLEVQAATRIAAGLALPPSCFPLACLLAGWVDGCRERVEVPRSRSARALWLWLFFRGAGALRAEQWTSSSTGSTADLASKVGGLILSWCAHEREEERECERMEGDRKAALNGP